MTAFDKMGLSDEVLAVLNDIGFREPSEIQQKAIPYLLSELTDFIGLAQTGTGKTAAYGLPIVDRIDPGNDSTQVLVLAPTRELCQQITEQLKLFSKNHSGINILPVYGGARMREQIQALKKEVQHVIVATPGRLIDLIGKKLVKLEQLHLLVLDEADEMLNMGFREEIDNILMHTPEEKMIWLFSATMPSSIKEIVKNYMHEPFEVRIKSTQRVNENISHLYACVNPKNKLEALKRILDTENQFKGIVFCRTKADTQNLAEELLKEDYKADALHGDLSQELRERVMKRFKKEEIDILVATDVAARGIDVNELSHIIHYSLPDDKEYYTHRSGRTARAGNKGISLALVSNNQIYRLKRLEGELNIKFDKFKIPAVGELIQKKLGQWAEDLVKSDISAEDEHYAEIFTAMLGQVDKQELVRKILAQKLSGMRNIPGMDLNESTDFKEKSKRRPKKGFTRNSSEKRKKNRKNRDGESKNYKGAKTSARRSKPPKKRK